MFFDRLNQQLSVPRDATINNRCPPTTDQWQEHFGDGDVEGQCRQAEHYIVLREETISHRPQQVDGTAVRNEHAFRLSCGPRCIDDVGDVRGGID